MRRDSRFLMRESDVTSYDVKPERFFGAVFMRDMMSLLSKLDTKSPTLIKFMLWFMCRAEYGTVDVRVSPLAETLKVKRECLYRAIYELSRMGWIEYSSKGSRKVAKVSYASGLDEIRYRIDYKERRTV